MDSGSGSIQSSSGGDEEYDSRAESISTFLNNNNPSSHAGPMPNPPPPQPPPQHHHHQTHSSSSMFDPLSNYFDPLSRSPNSLLNLDMVWPKTLRSDHNCTDLGGFMATSSQTQHFLTNQHQPQQSRATFPGCVQIPHQGPENIGTTRGSVSGSVSGTNDQTTSTTNNMVRNPKKRSRASRRAPTTVLTTDTTNFRAMVQEFTGIPAPPFTSSPFPRTRFDLFGSSSSTFRPHLDPSPPPYLLRPFPQKIHRPYSFASSSSSFVDALTSTTNITSGSTSNNSASANSTSINYQLPSDHLSILKIHQPHQDLLNLNTQQDSPILNFHSLLPKYPLPNSGPILANKPQGSLDDSHLKMGVLEELDLSRGHVNGNNSNNPANWGDGVGGSNENVQEGLLRSINGNYSNSNRVTNGRVNYSASSSDFHGDKGTQNVTAARSEGMVESWICSSD